MEHLFSSVDEATLAREVDYILDSHKAACDWDKAPLLEQVITWPVYEWLGFDHDSKQGTDSDSSWVTFQSYPSSRGCDGNDFMVPQNGDRIFRLYNEGRFLDERLTGSHPYLQVATNPHGFISMLQSWLIFGFLEAMCCICVSNEYLVRKHRGKTLLDTRRLVFLLHARHADIRQGSHTSDTYQLAHMQQALNEQKVVLQNLRDVFAWTGIDQVRDRSIARSSRLCWDLHMGDILLVATTIREIAVQYFNYHCTFHRIGQHLRDITLSDLRTLQRSPDILTPDDLESTVRSSKHGFCHSSLVQRGPMLINTREWLCWWSTRTRVPYLERHTTCNGVSCSLDHLSHQEEAEHHPLCSNSKSCPLIKPAWTEVSNALLTGRTPLLQIVKEGGSVIGLSVTPAADLSATSYFAFSHVWRQGLRSNTEAGLPTCQVEFLANVLSRLSNHLQHREDMMIESLPLFWIDSLCIPGVSDLRSKAVSNINEVMRHSKGICVLDKVFLALDVESSLTCRIAAGLCSAWQTRYVCFCFPPASSARTFTW